MTEPDHHCTPPTILQAAVALADALLSDGLSMSVEGFGTFGACSGDPVAAVIEIHRIVGEPRRPDVIDLYAARQQTRRDEISDEWIVTHMQQLLVACTGTEPVIV